MHKILDGSCIDLVPTITERITLTFLDPPFNQGKKYGCHDDNMPEKKYWDMMKDVCTNIYNVTKDVAFFKPFQYHLS